jgi:hypothetical protein
MILNKKYFEIQSLSYSQINTTFKDIKEKQKQNRSNINTSSINIIDKKKH